LPHIAADVIVSTVPERNQLVEGNMDSLDSEAERAKFDRSVDLVNRILGEKMTEMARRYAEVAAEAEQVSRERPVRS
jgi:hypothetical protein